MPFLDFNSKKKIKLFEGITASIHHSDTMTFTHVTLEKGAVLPEHHHVHEQWTHMIEGELELTMEGETKVLTPGTAVYIPSNTPHAAKAISQCKVIDCFLPIREDFKKLEIES